MSLKFKAGDSVQQVVNPIKGLVKELALTDDQTMVQFVVEWEDETGLHRRPFRAEELELQPAQDAAQ